MDIISHPISGERGYFCSELEKSVIDAIFNDFNVRHSLKLNEGVSNE